MEKKVLVLDIDGTLTNSKKEITDKTRHAIWDAVLRGHKVMLASGRPTPGMRRYEEELELARYGGYLLSFNGARIVECRTGEVIYQSTLSPGLVPGLYRYARERRMGGPGAHLGRGLQQSLRQAVPWLCGGLLQHRYGKAQKGGL